MSDELRTLADYWVQQEIAAKDRPGMAAFVERMDRAHKLLEERRRRIWQLEDQRETLIEALEAVKAWWDSVYPADVFVGECDDSGVHEVVRLRRLIDAALAKAKGDTP